MNAARGLVIVVLFSAAWSSPSLGQASRDPAGDDDPPEAAADRGQSNAGKSDFESLLKQAHDEALGHAASAHALPFPASAPDAESLRDLPEDVREAYHASLKAHYEQDTWALKQRQRIFEWQYYAGIVVFLVSVSVVVIGLYMSWIQFYSFYRQTQETAKHIETAAKTLKQVAATDAPPHEYPAQILNQIEVSAKGAKVTTPIVGVIILTLSLAFFYLYLKFVFPID